MGGRLATLRKEYYVVAGISDGSQQHFSHLRADGFSTGLGATFPTGILSPSPST
jgi:hypothetical protein